MNQMLINNELEILLKSNWTKFLNTKQLMLRTLQDINNTELPTLTQDKIPDRKTSVVVTNCNIQPNGFEIWVEFNVPIENKIAVGSHIYLLQLDGNLLLKNTYGTLLMKNIIQHQKSE